MHITTIIGFVLAAVIILTDHLIVKIPSKLAVLLYSIAVVLFVVGFILGKQQARQKQTRCL